MNRKKIFALLICAVLLSAAGCGKTPAPATAPATTARSQEISGVLFVSVGAEFKVIFDTDGHVMAVDPLTDAAADTLAFCGSYSGEACERVVSQLVEQCVARENNGENRVVVLKQAPGGQVPSGQFLEEVRRAAVAVTDFEVVLIPAGDLTGEGYMSPEAAKDILTRQLKLLDVAMTHSEVEDGRYTLTFELEGAEQEYKVSAVTGTVEIQPASDGGPVFDSTFEGEYESEEGVAP